MANDTDGGGAGGKFSIDFDELDELGASIIGKAAAWGEELRAVQAPLQAIVDMASFRGSGAEAAKAYISEVHMTILLCLGEILSELCARYVLYKDGYYTEFGEEAHARLDEQALDETYEWFLASRNRVEDAKNRIAYAALDVSDIVAVDIPNAFDLLWAYDTVLERVNVLRKDVAAYERRHLAGDFVNLDAMMDSLEAFIGSYLSESFPGPDAYVPGSVVDSPHIQALGAAFAKAYDDRVELSDRLQAAGAREQARFEALEAEWARQRAEQGAMQAVLSVLAVVGGAVCIVATAGMATPLVVAGLVLGTSAMAYGVSNLIEAGQDIYYGLSGDYTTTAINPFRDTIFAAAFGEDGKQAAWDAFGTVAVVGSSLLTLGVSGYAAFAQGAGRVAAFTTCRAAQVLGGLKGVAEFGVKTAVTVGAGALGGYVGREAALALGASEFAANLIGIGTGTVASMIAGWGMSKWEWSYEPGSAGIPEGVCFVAGTPVLTAAGPKPIEEVVVGDLVLSTDPETGVTAERRVTKTFARMSPELVCVIVGGTETLATPEHRYHVAARGWVDAADLRPGDILLGPSGEGLAVEGVSPVGMDGPVEVYNIEVEGSHTYYAGYALALVHNDCAPRRPRTDVIREVANPDESVTYTKMIDGEEVSVTYGKEGYPDFSPFAHPDYPDPVQIEYSGNRNTDFSRANTEAGIPKTPEGYTWHHMQDGKSMILVQTRVHGPGVGAFPHTGGFAINPVK